MPGILGIVGKHPPQEMRDMVQEMAIPMVFAKGQEPKGFVCGGFAGAVVDHDAAMSFLKRAWASRDGVLLLMEGEVFPEASEVPAALASPHPTIQRADYCLERYLQEGPGFALRLNGSFALAVFDGRDGKTHLFTDRLGTVPLFWWAEQAEFAFATSVRSVLLRRDDIGRRYSPEAVAELMVFERVFDARTLFSDIHRLPPGTHAIWSGSRLETRAYWTLPTEKGSEDRVTLDDAARDLCDRLRHSTARRCADRAPSMALISGGLDSRLLLACSPEHVQAGTFSNEGQAPSIETRLALEVSRALGRQHVLLHRHADHYADVAEAAPEVSEGLWTFASCHALGLHEQMAKAGVQAFLTGNYWDTLFKGYYLVPTEIDPIYKDEPVPLQARRLARHLANTPVLHRITHQDLLMLALSDEMKDCAAAAKERIIRTMTPFYSPRTTPEDFAEVAVFSQVEFDTAMGFQRSLRVRFVDRSPTFDNSLVDFACQTPIRLKKDGAIIRRALRLTHPQLGRILDANNGLPAGLASPWLDLAVGAKRRVRRTAAWFSRFSRTLTNWRTPPVGTGVCRQDCSWHDINALLVFSEKYRSLVTTTLHSLPDAMFDKPMIQRLLDDELSGRLPRFNKLFELILTFGLFDRQWGPGTNRKARGGTTPAMTFTEISATSKTP